MKSSTSNKYRVEQKILTDTTTLSIVTSTYRAEAYLPKYIRHALEVSWQLANQGITVEYVMIANDPTPQELQSLHEFRREHGNVHLIEVVREGVYASWNRGVRAAQGEIVGFWNVDDVRFSEPLIDGVQAIRGGCQLVYFAHTVVRTDNRWQLRPHYQTYDAIPYDPDAHRRRMKCGPFFIFARSLYDQVGAFDERFNIAGDWEWCIRATQVTDFCPIDRVAGYFWLHGANLSDVGNPAQTAEENIIRLMQGDDHLVVPIQPDVMRRTWERFDIPVSAEMQIRMWGAGAAERAVNYAIARRRARQRAKMETAIRYIPRQVIDRTGLRPHLARFGIVKNHPPRKRRTQ
jgi:glycosyltransferase involved in cell wall biosynthesis